MLQPQGNKNTNTPLDPNPISFPSKSGCVYQYGCLIRKEPVLFSVTQLHPFTGMGDYRVLYGYSGYSSHPKKNENQTAAEQLAELEAELEVHPCVGGWCS